MDKNVVQQFFRGNSLWSEEGDKKLTVFLIYLFSSIGIFVLFTFGLVNFYHDKPFLGFTELFFSVILILNASSFYFLNNISVAGDIMVGCVGIPLIILLFLGGIANTGLLWYSTYPLIAFYICGRKKGAIFASLLFIFTGLLDLAQSIGFIHLSFSGIEIRQLLANFFVISSLTYMYALTRESQRKALFDSFQHANFLADIVENSADAVIRMDMVGIIKYCNRAAQELFLYQEKELLGKHISILVPKDNLQEALGVLQKIKSDSQVKNLHTRRTRKDGQIIDVLLTAVAIKDPSGDIVGASAIIVDITKETELSRQIIREKAQSEAIVLNIGEGVIVTDADGNILLVNAAFGRLLGFSEQEVLGKKFSDAINLVRADGKIVEEHERLIYKALHGKVRTATVASQPLSYRKKDGQLLPVSIYVAPIMVAGQLTGAVQVFHDVSEEQKISHMKSDFISLVSHQLKTPVAQIKGFVSNMLDGLTGKLTKKQKEYLYDIMSVADKNSDLIDDLLSISRIERGVIKFDKEKIAVKDMLTQVIDPLRQVAERKHISLKEDFEIQTVVQIDKIKTIESIRNVLDNAIKFSPADGIITIIAKEEKGFLVVSVADQGSGIDPDVQKELFEKDRVWSGKVKASGSGLGLYLCKQFITLQGGNIDYVTSSKGTTFFIRILI